jgi:hypothetical protein
LLRPASRFVPVDPFPLRPMPRRAPLTGTAACSKASRRAGRTARTVGTRAPTGKRKWPRGPWAWQRGTCEVLGKAAARPLGATGCHARGQTCHTVSSRGHVGVTPLSLGSFSRSDEGCQRVQEGVEGVTGCRRGSKPLPHSWHPGALRRSGARIWCTCTGWRRASVTFFQMRAAI